MVRWRSQRFRQDLHSVPRRCLKGGGRGSEVFRDEKYLNNGSLVSILKLPAVIEVKKVG